MRQIAVADARANLLEEEEEEEASLHPAFVSLKGILGSQRVKKKKKSPLNPGRDVTFFFFFFCFLSEINVKNGLF